ncbi:MAG TPA: PilZ domain-containing protein [Spirochaetia bacterium]|nr:PilZ domain-containing protein [Spirochaetia bacterium]
MEDKIGSERRRVQRFSLKATAVVQTLSPGAERVFELATQDISSGGAFFPMELPLPTGEKVRITLYLSISPLEQISDFPRRAQITTKGHVVRSTTRGMAVAFDRRYTISPATV